MPTRRDLAKQETRSALVDAALGLLREQGAAGLSADDIAARAGVSRRTFFNYFGTTEAVLAVPSIDYLDEVVAAVRARPRGEPLMDSVVVAMTAAPPEVLARFAETVRRCQGDAVAERVEREVWAHAVGEIADALRARLEPDVDPLRVRVLAEAVMAAGRVAVDAWAASLPDTTTQADPQGLRAGLITAFGYLTDGYPDVAPAASRH